MAQTNQPIFDIDLLNLHRKRALVRHGTQQDKSPDFLLKYVAQDILARLDTITRQFENVVELFGRTGEIANALTTHPSIKNVIRLELENFYIENSATLVKMSDEETFNLEPAKADLIVSAFALHWSNNLPGSLMQIIQGLRPDGLFLGLLPGPETLTELRTCFAHVENELFGGISPRVDLFVSVQSAGSLLQNTGFAMPVVDTEKLTLRYDSAFDLVRDLRAMGATNALNIRERHRFSRDLFDKVSQHYADNYSDPDGRIRATFEFVSLSGWAPHGSQQQPMRPGSAKTNLAEILKQARVDD